MFPMPKGLAGARATRSRPPRGRPRAAYRARARAERRAASATKVAAASSRAPAAATTRVAPGLGERAHERLGDSRTAASSDGHCRGACASRGDAGHAAARAAAPSARATMPPGRSGASTVSHSNSSRAARQPRRRARSDGASSGATTAERQPTGDEFVELEARALFDELGQHGEARLACRACSVIACSSLKRAGGHEDLRRRRLGAGRASSSGSTTTGARLPAIARPRSRRPPPRGCRTGARSRTRARCP